MSSMIQKKAYTIVITKDETDNLFIGQCDELHANSQGKTYGEIMENIKEAVECAVEESGNTDDFNMLIVSKHAK